MKDSKCQIKRNDKVKVIAGKDKGKIGKVLKVITKKSSVLIEGINIVKRHTSPKSSNRQGGIIESEAHIHWSNVMLMCIKCVTAVRFKKQRLEDGKNMRVCLKCGEIID